MSLAEAGQDTHLLFVSHFNKYGTYDGDVYCLPNESSCSTQMWRYSLHVAHH